MDTFLIFMDFVTLESQKGCIPMLNFFDKKMLAILGAKNKVYTFSNPAPEVSPVLTLGICCKGQGRTRGNLSLSAENSYLKKIFCKVELPVL